MTKNKCTIYQQNINILMKEIYKVENDLFSPLIDDLFQTSKIDYNLQKTVNTKKISVKMGLGTISYRAAQLWNLIFSITMQRDIEVMVL